MRHHFLSGDYEWTTEGASIVDIRRSRRPYTIQLKSLTQPGATINDPQFGGLFGFGLVACYPTDGHEPDPANFWNECWELTSRNLDKVTLAVDGDLIIAHGEWSLPILGVVAMVTWNCHFVGNSARLHLSIYPIKHKGLWFKEPKVVANGWLGYHTLEVLDNMAQHLETHDLVTYGDPRFKTLQINNPKRHEFVLSGPQLPTVSTMFDNGFSKWYVPANAAPPMSQNSMNIHNEVVPAPKYCLTPDGNLKCQTEIPRWGNLDQCGICDHGWEGGYGAPDCWNTFRPWPSDPVNIEAMCYFHRT